MQKAILAKQKDLQLTLLIQDYIFWIETFKPLLTFCSKFCPAGPDRKGQNIQIQKDTQIYQPNTYFAKIWNIIWLVDTVILPFNLILLPAGGQIEMTKYYREHYDKFKLICENEDLQYY